jgi:hypothetical protein
MGYETPQSIMLEKTYTQIGFGLRNYYDKISTDLIVLGNDLLPGKKSEWEFIRAWISIKRKP